jgi:DNA-binding PadR family transcriptional regulator
MICLTKSQEIKYMKRTYLGEFEEVVLLTIALLPEATAYGVALTQEIEKQTGRVVDFSTVHTTLKRLEEKGFTYSKMGGATPERGGRRKRLYTLTTAGYQALRDIQEVRNHYWSIIPKQLQLKGI